MTIRPPTLKTIYLLVTCCMEDSRQEILEKVLTQFVSCKHVNNILPYMIAFDNGSTNCQTVDLVKKMLSIPTYVASQNLGYWSAIKWVFDNVDLSYYDYIHIIESDHFYFGDLWNLDKAERCLSDNQDIGGVRLQEYSVSEQHLYNKTLGRNDGRKYAWVSHKNAVTGEAVSFKRMKIKDIYESNFLTQLHGLNRLQTMKDVFDELGASRFSELDFQRLYHKRFPKIAVLDNGLFHAKLGFTPYNSKALSGSWSKDVTSVGYKTTREDTILRYPKGSVVDAWK